MSYYTQYQLRSRVNNNYCTNNNNCVSLNVTGFDRRFFFSLYDIQDQILGRYFLSLEFPPSNTSYLNYYTHLDNVSLRGESSMMLCCLPITATIK